METIKLLENFATMLMGVGFVLMIVVSAMSCFGEKRTWKKFFIVYLSEEDEYLRNVGWVCVLVSAFMLAYLHGLLAISVWLYLVCVICLLLTIWVLSKVFSWIIFVLERIASFIVLRFWK